MSTVLSTRDAHVAWITLNRPEAMNTLDLTLAQELDAALDAVAGDATVRAVVIRGGGPAFMAGGDIKFFGRILADELPASELASLFDYVHGIIRKIRNLPVPVLAAVHGSAAGYGLSLMASCDMAMASESTKFTLAYRHLGVSPDGGSTWFLPRIVGVRRAMEIALLGDRFDAEEALGTGLLNRVVPDESFDDEVRKLAQRLASGPPQAIARTKALIYGSMESTLDSQLDAEQTSFLKSTEGPEFREGVSAFLEKRAPDFSGDGDAS